jgi:hypothetical protein
LFSRTIKFPVMARFRLSEAAGLVSRRAVSSNAGKGAPEPNSGFKRLRRGACPRHDFFNLHFYRDLPFHL